MFAQPSTFEKRMSPPMSKDQGWTGHYQFKKGVNTVFQSVIRSDLNWLQTNSMSEYTFFMGILKREGVYGEIYDEWTNIWEGTTENRLFVQVSLYNYKVMTHNMTNIYNFHQF